MPEDLTDCCNVDVQARRLAMTMTIGMRYIPPETFMDLQKRIAMNSIKMLHPFQLGKCPATNA
jgi:hypothetical protein